MPHAEEHINKRLAKLGLTGVRIPGSQTIRVNGKTSIIKFHVRTNAFEWLLSAIDENPAAEFYCFICFSTNPAGQPQDWLVPGQVVGQVVTRSHQAWLARQPEQLPAPPPLRKFRLDYSTRYPELSTEYGAGWADEFNAPPAWERLVTA